MKAVSISEFQILSFKLLWLKSVFGNRDLFLYIRILHIHENVNN